ncbi:tyrosine-type recombinase/integrase [Capsulimonas corticalis]|uniref:tyrosine-type recombinase/integrase n=1 Tax=Capsulimonas corticalis TaxID=2219043 RepID=UPI0026190835|nr:site-specific integrase [Capsulimonas corticalis]
MRLGEPPPLCEHPAAVYLASLAPGSRRTMRQALGTMAEILSNGECDIMTLDWAALRYKHTSALRAVLLESYETTTVKKMIAALKRVLQESWRLGLMSAEDYHRAADLSVKVGTRLPRGRDISEGEMRSLFKACKKDQTLRGRRDAAILAVLNGCGIREQEIADLIVGDYVPDTGEVTIRAGKGDKQRVVYSPDGTMAAMDDYLAHLVSHGPVYLAKAAPLFPAINKGGRVGRNNITAGAIYLIVKARGKKAMVDELTVHDFRRSFVGNSLDAGEDIVTVQKACGHADVKTTANYDRRGKRKLRGLAGKLVVPYES